MGIRVKHGAGIALDMAKQAGDAQGRALIAESEDAALRQGIFEGLQIGAIAARQRLATIDRMRERELDRALDREKLDESLASRAEIQRDKDQQAWNRKIADVDLKRDVVGMQEEGRDRRLGVAEEGKDRRLGSTLEFKTSEGDKNRAQKQPVFDSTAELNRSRQMFNLSQTDFTDARRKELEGRVQNAIQSEEGIKQMYTDPTTGEYTPDLRAETMLSFVRNGKPIPPALLQETPWKSKSERRAYAPMTMDERQASGLAVNNPEFAIRVLGHKRSIADPSDPTGQNKVAQPTQDAMHMAAALSVLHNSEDFTPAAGPGYYNDLMRASEKYGRLAEQAMVPGPDGTLSPESQAVQLAAQNLKMRVEEVKRVRQTTLLPDLDRKAKMIAGKLPIGEMGPALARAWAELGEQNGVSPEEFDEWTRQMQAESPLFGAPQPKQGQDR